jgi:hypothetical protein
LFQGKNKIHLLQELLSEKNRKMKQISCIVITLLFTAQALHSQILKGKISSMTGDPIQYSTVYIQELKQGTTANTKGDYEIKLPAGTYTVIYQSLGFEQVMARISISDDIVTKNVILPVQYYQIPEVRISASGEDPAYIIMRKVIGLAPYYLNNISYYKADVYLKGNLVVKKIPKLMKRSVRIEARDKSGSPSGSTLKEGDSYFMESFNEIEFHAPEKYSQRVISFKSTFPKQGDEISPMDFIKASFYQPVLANIAISPLSPAAFSHYRFRYLGSSLQGDNIVNKIEVIPKRKSQQLFSGTIYIIEDLWCLHSVDLVNENLAGKVRIQQLYVPVEEGIWMPVSHKFEVNIDIVGVKADAGYGSSVKYIDVKPNTALQKPKTISTDYTGRQAALRNHPDTALPEIDKSQEKIEKILEKDKLSNRDMMKLARLMEKESGKSITDSSKNNLEIKDNTTRIIDKDAGKKDSAYWNAIRPIPLSDIEMEGLRKSDSIKSVTALQVTRKDTTVHATGKSNFLKTAKEIAFGHRWSDTTGLSFNFGGITDIKNLSFNTVDGLVFGLDCRLSKSWNNRRSVSIAPSVSWAFSRERLMWVINGNYTFNRMKQSQFFLRSGLTSKDIGNGGSINSFINSITSLFLKENYLKLYESGYFTLGFRSEIVNGLTMELSGGTEKRVVLQNTTDFSIIRSDKQYSENIPANIYLTGGSNPLNSPGDQRHSEIAIKVTYTPAQKYRISRGSKIPEGSDWPTLNFTWGHGMTRPQGQKLYSTDMLKLELFSNRSIGAFSNLRWRIGTGGYIDNRSISFFDFFHFNSQSFPLLLDDFQDAFMIPSFYSLSTPEAYGEFHLKYTTPYLLLKLLPGISKTLMRENVSISYLGSRFHMNYTELGYSISEIFLIAEAGVYAGFSDTSFRSAGLKLIIRLH